MVLGVLRASFLRFVAIIIIIINNIIKFISTTTTVNIQTQFNVKHQYYKLKKARKTVILMLLALSLISDTK